MRATLMSVGMTALLLVGSACSPPTIRNCVLEHSVPDQGHALDYQAVMPSDCPVPLGSIAERKFIGATVYDFNDADYDYVEVLVENSQDAEKGSDVQFFQNYGGVGKRAQPRAEFDAATGYNGSIENGQELPPAATDRGSFHAVLLTGATGAYAELLVSYIGSSMHATISGPDVPVSGSIGTWTGSVSGGSAPYTYAWYKNGELVSTSSSYSANVGSSEFGLRLVVTDQTTASRWTDFLVDVGGMRSSISGPGIIYYSEGLATWTANVRGGYTPYTVNWYLRNSMGEDTYVGSGMSLTMYPSQAGQYTLIAEAIDAASTTMTSSMNIHAIGDGNGGCVPTPPQIVCDPD
jgi:hypothetical protein